MAFSRGSATAAHQRALRYSHHHPPSPHFLHQVVHAACSTSTPHAFQPAPMRRAAVAIARSVHRPVRRVVVRARAAAAASDGSAANALFTSTTRNLARQYPRGTQILLSSMQLRSFSIALASSLVASGAYWAYQGTSSESTTSPIPPHFPIPSHSMAGPSYERQPISFDARILNSVELPSELPVIKQNDPITLGQISPQQATVNLRQHEESYFVRRGQGVVRYDSVQLPSNNPIEDDHTEEWSLDGNGNDWMFWGVFDGHAGFATSYMLRKWLVQFVGVELDKVYKNKTIVPSPDAIDSAIKKGFVELDNKLVYDAVKRAVDSQSKAMATHVLRPATSGSCALLSFYDAHSKTLRVACTGDSRAVLGRRGPNGLWTVTPLSTDYTGGTPEEVERLRREHPGEPHVVRNGRILGGLEPSRAFGDAVYKWGREVYEALDDKVYLGRAPRSHFLTPPYVTAEPVVTTTKIQPEKGDFVVMATDGLWEFLSNEEVVGLVGKWLEKQQSQNSSNTSATGNWLKGWFPSSSSSTFLPVNRAQQLPLADPNSGNAKDVQGQRAPIRELNNRASDAERFVVEDQNVATHLVRNALGGKDRDRVCALMTLAYPQSRRFRDDITVEVIFFGEEGPVKGGITVNRDASGMTNARL